MGLLLFFSGRACRVSEGMLVTTGTTLLDDSVRERETHGSEYIYMVL